jgi:hypothetical protein
LDDGGSKLTGFVVEKKTPNGQWEEILEVGPKDASVTLKEVKEGEECQFRIKAKNAVGLSNPSKPTDVIKVQDQPRNFGYFNRKILYNYSKSNRIFLYNKEKPTFELSHSKDIVVKSGQNYEIHIPFKAHPLPKAEWTNNDFDLNPEEGRIEIKVSFFQNFNFQ